MKSQFEKKMRQVWAFALMGAMLSSCSSGESGTSSSGQSSSSGSSTSASSSSTSTSEGKFKIVTTSFHEYDWVREILGERLDQVDLTVLMDNGVDLHSYSPSVDDIITIGNADLFFYSSGVSVAAWVDDALGQSKNPDLLSVDFMEVLGESVKMEEYVEGMETTSHDHDDEHDHAEDDHDHDEDDHDHAEDDHDHAEDDHAEDDHDHAEDDHDHDEDEHDHDEHDHDEDEHSEESHAHNHEDEHTWLSLKNAKVMCQALGEKIMEMDPDFKDVYQENLDNYLEKLDELDKSYQDVVDSGARDVILVADRFPFLYMASDYGIDYYAAFSGCSAETEASFETVIFLAEKVNELNLMTVLTTETGNKIAETVVSNTADKNQEILVLDSIQSTTSKGSDTYLSIMEENRQVLEQALN